MEAYTSFAGSRCAFPFLTDAYGLYYNTDMFDKAGITDPPTTLTELQDDAKKLTEFNSDGSIKRAGFVPWLGYYEFSVPNLGNIFGAKWYNEDATQSAVATDPQWKAAFQWQHDFIADVYGDGDFQTGADLLERFVAGAGDEFSTAHDMYTGRIAMNLDGEWRTAFIDDEKPNLPYATAPFPLPDDQSGPVRSRSDRRDDHRPAEGVSAPGGGVAAAPVHGDRHGDAGLHGQQRPQRADDAGVRCSRRTWTSRRSSRRSWTSSRTRTRTIRSRPRSVRPTRTRCRLFASKWQVGKETDLDAGLADAGQADRRPTRAGGDLEGGAWPQH